MQFFHYCMTEKWPLGDGSSSTENKTDTIEEKKLDEDKTEDSSSTENKAVKNEEKKSGQDKTETVTIT